MQIASAALAKVSVNVQAYRRDERDRNTVRTSVSEHIGERAIDFVERLAQWRNLHLTDDADGNLVMTRAGSSGSSSATLIEGVNIESARLLENRQFTPNRISLTTQRAGNDQTNGTASSQVFASQNVANYKGPGAAIFVLRRATRHLRRKRNCDSIMPSNF